MSREGDERQLQEEHRKVYDSIVFAHNLRCGFIGEGRI